MMMLIGPSMSYPSPLHLSLGDHSTLHDIETKLEELANILDPGMDFLQATYPNTIFKQLWGKRGND